MMPGLQEPTSLWGKLLGQRYADLSPPGVMSKTRFTQCPEMEGSCFPSSLGLNVL